MCCHPAIPNKYFVILKVTHFSIEMLRYPRTPGICFMILKDTHFSITREEQEMTPIPDRLVLLRIAEGEDRSHRGTGKWGGGLSVASA